MNFKFIVPNKKNDLENVFVAEIQGKYGNKRFKELGEAVDFVKSITGKDIKRDDVKRQILEKDCYTSDSYRNGDSINIMVLHKGSCDICGNKKTIKRLVYTDEPKTYICEYCYLERSFDE